jgi:hypothetical protein
MGQRLSTHHGLPQTEAAFSLRAPAGLTAALASATSPPGGRRRGWATDRPARDHRAERHWPAIADGRTRGQVRSAVPGPSGPGGCPRSRRAGTEHIRRPQGASWPPSGPRPAWWALAASRPQSAAWSRRNAWLGSICHARTRITSATNPADRPQPSGDNAPFRWGRTAEDVQRAVDASLPQSDPSHAFCALGVSTSQSASQSAACLWSSPIRGSRTNPPEQPNAWPGSVCRARAVLARWLSPVPARRDGAHPAYPGRVVAAVGRPSL